jgi:hypothetical protein
MMHWRLKTLIHYTLHQIVEAEVEEVNEALYERLLVLLE